MRYVSKERFRGSEVIIELTKKMYLDYVNDFLTVERFAEYYQISEEYALAIINEGRKLIKGE